MPNLLDGCAEEGPLVMPALLKPKIITNAQVQKCINQLALELAEKALEMMASSPSSKVLLRWLQTIRVSSEDLLKLNKSFLWTRSGSLLTADS